MFQISSELFVLSSLVIFIAVFVFVFVFGAATSLAFTLSRHLIDMSKPIKIGDSVVLKGNNVVYTVVNRQKPLIIVEDSRGNRRLVLEKTVAFVEKRKQ